MSFNDNTSHSNNRHVHHVTTSTSTDNSASGQRSRGVHVTVTQYGNTVMSVPPQFDHTFRGLYHRFLSLQPPRNGQIQRRPTRDGRTVFPRPQIWRDRVPSYRIPTNHFHSAQTANPSSARYSPYGHGQGQQQPLPPPTLPPPPPFPFPQFKSNATTNPRHDQSGGGDTVSVASGANQPGGDAVSAAADGKDEEEGLNGDDDAE